MGMDQSLNNRCIYMGSLGNGVGNFAGTLELEERQKFVLTSKSWKLG